MEELLPVVAITPDTAMGVIEGWREGRNAYPSVAPGSSRGPSPRSSSITEGPPAPPAADPEPSVPIERDGSEGAGPRDEPGATSGAWLEVGSGGGEHLAWQAARNPGALMIGVEPFLNGVSKLLGLIDDGGLTNVRVHKGDARRLMAAMPDGCLSRMFVLHPDPWPKRKHHKRRIVSQPFLADAHRLLRPGAELRVASDIPDYVRWTLMWVHRQGGFDWTARRAADWTERPDDWPQTRYEAKALREGRVPTYLSFRRR